MLCRSSLIWYNSMYLFLLLFMLLSKIWLLMAMSWSIPVFSSSSVVVSGFGIIPTGFSFRGYVYAYPISHHCLLTDYSISTHFFFFGVFVKSSVGCYCVALPWGSSSHPIGSCVCSYARVMLFGLVLFCSAFWSLILWCLKLIFLSLLAQIDFDCGLL